MNLNPENYEVVTKMKTTPTLTLQQLYDSVLRFLVKQQVPCRVPYQKILETDPDPQDMDEDDLFQSATFNMNGHRSPLLVKCSMEDMRVLKRDVGYEPLQYFSTFEIRELEDRITRSGWEVNQDSHPLLKVWDRLGIRTAELIDLVVELEYRHENWYNYTTSTFRKEGGRTEYSVRQSLKELVYVYNHMPSRFHLDHSVLKGVVPN